MRELREIGRMKMNLIKKKKDQTETSDNIKEEGKVTEKSAHKAWI